MSDIKKSIIVFNGGSAGDFLKTMCLQQLPGAIDYNLTSTGKIFIKNEYFKRNTEKLNCAPITDLDKITTVDNTHFYHPWYHSIAKVYYIDYPLELQPLLTKVYIDKNIGIYNNDYDKFLQAHLEFVPVPLRKHITIDRIDQLFNIHYSKNLRLWRTNPALTRINLADFFDLSKFTQVVEMLCNQPINDANLFDISYKQWVDKNNTIHSALT